MSMESAAMARMLTNATVTSAMVKPRSFGRDAAFLRGRWISGGSMRSTSVLVECGGTSGKAGRSGKGAAHQTGHAVESPLIRILNGDACTDQIYCVPVDSLLCNATPIDGEHEASVGSARRACGGFLPSERAAGLHQASRAKSTGTDILRHQIAVYDPEGIGDRDGQTRAGADVVGGIGGRDSRALARGIREFLLQRNRSAEVKDSHHKNHQQRQGEGKLHDLRSAVVGPDLL